MGVSAVEHVGVGWVGGLPRRPVSGHKGTFGTVCVVGGCSRGSRRYVGAPGLAGLGALRSGCGLLRVMSPGPVIGHVLEVVSSATGVALSVGRDGGLKGGDACRRVVEAAEAGEVLVVGPGLGDGAGVDALARRVWHGVASPVVLDADGLNALARQKTIGVTGGRVVITPHPGEAKRLMARLNMRGDPTAAGERVEIAAEMARRLDCVVVLKGSRTVVSDGARAYVNRSGGPWLGTGGTGDVLSGVIGGLVAQHGGLGLFRLACLAVLVHGRAGDGWAEEHRATGGMLAAELAERVAREVERVRTRPRRR